MQEYTIKALCKIKVNYIKGHSNIIENIEKELFFTMASDTKKQAREYVKELCKDNLYISYKLEKATRRCYNVLKTECLKVY